MSAEFEFDFSEFNKEFKKIDKLIIKAIKDGMTVAGIQLMNDAMMEEPTVPHKEGYLRGSGSVFVQNKMVGKSTQGNNRDVNTNMSEEIPNNTIMVVVGFNTPYAARWHEVEPGTVTFQEPSAGPKFLEKKLVQNKKTYFKIVANRIKRARNA